MRSPVRRARVGWAAALVVVALAGVARAQAPARAPGLTVTLTPARAFMLLGSETELTIDVEVTGPGAETFAPTRTFATVGGLEPLQPTGAPGHFKARYVAPAEHFPQVALLVAELGAAGVGGPQRLRGTLRLPLHGSTEMPLRTSPLATVTLRVGDQSFGPAAADRMGNVTVPIRVPPGMRTGVARAVDRNGNVKETEVDLQPPPFRRVLVIAPPVLEVGSYAEVAVIALDALGEPAAVGRLSLRDSDGLVHPLGEGGPGEARFLIEAPRRLGTGALLLTGAVAGTPVSRAELTVALVAGRPRSLSLSTSHRRLVIGGGAQSRIVVSAHDQFGNPTSADHAEATVEGVAVPVRVTAGGLGMLVVPPPARYEGKDRMTVLVTLGVAEARQEILLTGGSPASLSLAAREGRVVADGRRATELRARALDSRGTPTLVPGLSWETPGGRIRGVRMPREGEYVAEYVPDRARVAHGDTVAVMAGADLRAAASLEVVPPPTRFLLGGSVGFFSNLGHLSGPAAFLEALAPLPRSGGRFMGGVLLGYLRGDVTLGPAAGDVVSRLEIDQFPALALARYRIPSFALPELSVGAGVGVAVAATRLTPDVSAPRTTVDASAWAVALELGGEAAVPLRPGRLVLGARYLWVDLGRTSHGDYVRGNAAGLTGHVGYRMIW
jgi:hypothetical protein